MGRGIDESRFRRDEAGGVLVEKGTRGGVCLRESAFFFSSIFFLRADQKENGPG